MQERGKKMDGYFTIRRIVSVLICVLVLVLAFGSASSKAMTVTREPLDYGDSGNWAYMGSEDGESAADVFFIAPASFGGKEGSYILDLSNEKTRTKFIGGINMEKGIYDQGTRFYAPFYRQVGYNVYSMTEEESEPMIQSALADVKDAFAYYMANLNDGRPMILVGFSEGADLAIRLMKDCFDEKKLQDQLIACYAIGWRLTQEELDTWPFLRAAGGEADTGVIITFDSEAEDVQESIIIPAGTKTCAINPLNWKTDGEKAGKELNAGACFTNFDGEIENEVSALTGAYLDEKRGALKVTDVDPEVYNMRLPILGAGSYHLYDYQFFYKNLKQNVQKRIQAYFADQ